MITEKDIKHIAKLSKLEFADAEIEKFSADINGIIDYINTLSKIDTSSVVLENQALNIDELRNDEVKPSLSQEVALQNAPKKRGGGFSVPAVIE